MLPTSTPSASLAQESADARTGPAPCGSAQELSLRQLVDTLRRVRQTADEGNSALLVWLLSGVTVAAPQRERFLASLPETLLGGYIHWLPVRGDRLAVVVTDLAVDDLDSVYELMAGAIPEKTMTAAFAYPTGWYETDNELPGQIKPKVTLGPSYLTLCAANADIRRAVLGLTGKSYLCLEPAFFQPTPFWKRSIDVVATLAALIALAPLFLLIAGIIKLRSPGPLFFWQARHGGAGRKFQMCKFRTMDADFDATQHSHHLRSLLESGRPLEKLKAERALIPHAKWIRSTGLDELPQLWNVLRGEMSLVGPRPTFSPWIITTRSNGVDLTSCPD